MLLVVLLKNADSGGSGFPVNITDPQEGQILTFDSENEQWVNSNGKIKVVTVTSEEKTATQEDVDNYGWYYDALNDEINDIEVDETYIVFEISANYNEISNYDVVVIQNNGCFITSGYGISDEVYHLFEDFSLENIKRSYYSLNGNANLRKYVIFTTPTPPTPTPDN